MEKADLLKPWEKVTVDIYGPDGKKLSESNDSGFHTLDEAIKNAISRASLGMSPEDCVFEVTNRETGVSHRYRLNAHGNLKLII